MGIGGRRGQLARCLLAAVVLSGSSACSPWRQSAALPSRWVPSPNADERRIAFVIIHYTGDSSVEGARHTLTDPAAQVSAHYLIAREGGLEQLVDERARAWHAGESRWGTVLDVNSASIGIELDNDGAEPYPEAQIATLLRLLDDLRRRHRLAAASFQGHADVAPARKVDPGPFFPWRRLAAEGFGLWCEPPYPPAAPGFDPLLGLRAIGYDTRRPEAAMAAFRIHHRPGTPAEAPLDQDVDLIACLARQSLETRPPLPAAPWERPP